VRLRSISEVWEKFYGQIVFCVLLLGILLRCLHLLNFKGHYLVTADSYYFHWLVGKGDISVESGLVGPVYWLSKIVGVYASEIVVPLVIFILTFFLLYYMANRLFGRGVALLSALSFSLVLPSIYIGSGGYIDRDGLSIFVILLGLTPFILRWKPLFGIPIYTLCNILLYLTWGPLGVVILLALLVLFAFCSIVVNWVKKKELNKRAILYLVGLVVIVSAIFGFGFGDHLGHVFKELKDGKFDSTSEMSGIGIGGIFTYGLFLLPVILGIYSIVKLKTYRYTLFLYWFLGCLALSFLSSRILLYALPATCILSGTGLYYIYTLLTKNPKLVKISYALVSCIISLLMITSLIGAYGLGGSNLVAPKYWVTAMEYLQAQDDGRVISNWGNGYWIQGLSGKIPLVSNGIRSGERDKDIELIYGANETSIVVSIIDKYSKYNVQYIVFWSGDKDKYKEVGRVYTNLFEENDSNLDGLQVIYMYIDKDNPLKGIVIVKKG
jgi:asparagine N-glycosylation enzyme membrane subunit Stt3